MAVGEDWLCRACLAAIGRFFRECPEDARSRIWGSPLGDLVAAELQDLTAGDERYRYRVEEVFEQFVQGLSGVDIAISARAMGLGDLARTEAAFALEHGAEALGPRVADAAGILLGKGALRTSLTLALETLRGALFPD